MKRDKRIKHISSREEHHEFLKKKYPLEHIDKEIENIEKLGYTVMASEYQCLIFDGEILIIDSDNYNDYYLNVIEAIYAFYFEK